MKIVTTHKNKCLQGLQLPAAESVDPKLVFGIVVEIDMGVVIRLVGNDASHGEDHVEQSQPWSVIPSSAQVISSKGWLVEQWNKDLNSLEVRIDKGLAF